MIRHKKIKAGEKYCEGFIIKLFSKNFILIRGGKGYIMCGYLNMAAANKFKDVAIKITGVSNIKEALAAKVFSRSVHAGKLGIFKGQPVKDVLKIIA